MGWKKFIVGIIKIKSMPDQGAIITKDSYKGVLFSLISGFLFVMSDSNKHMENIKDEKFIIRVIRKRNIEIPPIKDSSNQIPRMEENRLNLRARIR